MDLSHQSIWTINFDALIVINNNSVTKFNEKFKQRTCTTIEISMYILFTIKQSAESIWKGVLFSRFKSNKCNDKYHEINNYAQTITLDRDILKHIPDKAFSEGKTLPYFYLACLQAGKVARALSPRFIFLQQTTRKRTWQIS